MVRNTACIRVPLEYGADPNERSVEGGTPLTHLMKAIVQEAALGADITFVGEEQYRFAAECELCLQS